MKKWAKFLILFLALSVLVGLLAVTVLAEGETTETGTPWQPTSSTAWAVFENEDAFINKAQPLYSSDSNTYNAGTVYGWVKSPAGTAFENADTSDLYVRLYKNVTLTGCKTTFIDSGKITFDLGGCTLSPNESIIPNSSNSVTVQVNFKNGTLNLGSDRYIRAYQRTTINFEDMENVRMKLINYVSGGSFYFKNSTVTCLDSKAFLLGVCAPETNPTISFVNSDLILNSNAFATTKDQLVVSNANNVSSAIFNIFANTASDSSNNYGWTIIFDKNSSITAPNMTGTPLFFAINQTVAKNNVGVFDGSMQAINAEGDPLAYSDANKPKIYFEDGFVFNDSKTIPTFEYYLNKTASKTDYELLTATGAADKCKIALATFERDSDGNITGYTPLEHDDYRFIKLDDGSSLATSKTPWQPEEGSTTTHAFWKDELSYIIGDDPASIPTTSKITSTQFKDQIADGNKYMVLFKNVECDSSDAIMSANATFVINCNGNELYFTVNMVIGDGVKYDLTIKNGSLKVKGNNGLRFRGTTSKLTLYDVDCDLKHLGYGSGGDFTATDCSFKLEYGLYLNNYYSNGKALTFNNCTFNFTKSNYNTVAGSVETTNWQQYFPIAINNGHATYDITLNFNDCTFDTLYDREILFVGIQESTKPTNQNAYINFNDGCKFERHLIPDETYTIQKYGVSSYVTTKAESTTDPALEICNGGYWYAVEEGGQYALYSTDKGPELAPGQFTANLMLSTNFVMNFKADPTVIGGFIADGKALNSLPYNADSTKVRYEVPVMANEAADNVFMLVGIKQKDDSVRYYPLNYSVLKYAEQIMATNDDDAKLLVSAAMEYVKAAYTFDGKTAPAFTGVTVTAATNNAKAPDITAISSLVRGAQLDLDSGFKLRFNLVADSNGTLYVDGVKYDVVNGKVGDLTYVEVDRRAYDLANAVVLSVDGASVEYGIANYANSKNVEGTSAKALANALYTYCCIAKTYNENK